MPRVRLLTVGLGGDSGLTGFSDSFARADQPFYFGQNWYTDLMPTSVIGSGPNLSLAINVAANRLVLGDGGSNFGNMFFVGIPRGVFPPSIINHAQFAQMVIAAGSNGGVGTGPACFIGANDDNGYVARTVNVAGNRQIAIARQFGTGSAIIGINQNVNYGDTVRLEVRPSAPSNDVRLLVNGVQVDIVIDNNAARPRQGMFGIAFLGNVNATDSWTAFQGGLL